MKEDYILCELYENTLSNVFDNGENEILNNDSDIPTASSRKQLRPAVVFTSNSETSTEEAGSSELESCDDKTSDVWCKTDKKPSSEPFLGTTGFNIVVDNPESVVEVMSLINQ